MNNLAEKFIQLVKEPAWVIKRKCVTLFPKIIPDKWFIQVKYYKCFGRKLDLKNPQTFNEKLQWLKIHDRNPLYTVLVDKYRVKQYVADKIGEEYVIPTLAVYQSVDEIDLDKLPEQFVLKCNHDSGSVVICRDKSKFDWEIYKEKLRKALNENYYYDSREWPYKRIHSCIISEKYLDNGDDLYDYKFFCFNGVVQYYKIDYNREFNHGATYFTRDGVELPYYELACPKNPNMKIAVSDNLQEMISLAETLSCGLPFVRVDFFDVNGILFFGEYTFFPTGGFGSFSDESFDYMMGNLMNIN